MTTNDKQRLQLLEDQFAIQQLEYRYARAIDQCDHDLLNKVFTQDAVFIYDAIGESTGLDAFKAAIESNWPILDATHHMIFSPTIIVEGNTAHCSCYAQAQHIRTDFAPDFMLLMGGNYEDDLQRIDGEWLITKRIMKTVWGIGNPAILGMDEKTAFVLNVRAAKI